MQLVDAKKFKEAVGFKSTAQVYEHYRRGHFPDGVVVRIGPRQLRFNLEAAKEWFAKGGTPLNDQQTAASATGQ